jgi:TPR repeat protein
MAGQSFQDITEKYSLTVKLDETAPPELWAAKLRDELAAKQGKLQETGPQHLLRFVLEKQCLELEEAVQFLDQEIRRNGQPQKVDKIRQIEDELAAKQSKLQETNPQNLLYFALQKECRELAELVQVKKQEARRNGQQALLEKTRQAVQDGDKDLYDSLIKGEPRSLLPTEDEAEYSNWLGIKMLASEKRWSRSPTPPSSTPIITEQLPPPPAPTPPVPGLASPQSDIAAQPFTQQPATPSPQAPSEMPETIPVQTERALPKRPRINPWVWVLPTAVIAVVALYLLFRHSDQMGQVDLNPPFGPMEGSQASPEAPLAGPVTLDGLMLLFDDANKATNSENRARGYRAFLQKSADFAAAHPDQANIWVKRAKAAMELDYPTAGWSAGKQLTALSLIHREDPELRRVMADLEGKGWLGTNRPQRDWKALAWTIEKAIAAANDGDEEAQVELGNGYFRGQPGLPKDYAEAAQWYRKAAEQGNSAGQEHLATMYRYGRGVPQDFAEALKWFHKAADAGDAEGQNNLAFLYLNGFGGKTNYLEALGWFSKSADQGSSAAQVNLGLMYENGLGVKTNTAMAMSWYRKAVALGNSNAEPYLQRLAQSGHDGAPK